MKVLKSLLFLVLLLLPFGQLTRIPLPGGEINLYLQDIIIGFIGMISYIRLIRIQEKPALTKPILIFSLVAGFSLLINWKNWSNLENLVAFLYLLRWVAYAGVYFAISNLREFKGLEVQKFKSLLIIAGLVCALLGLIQYFFYPDLANLSYLGWDPHLYRVFGTFLDPGFLGIILVLTIVLILDSQQASQGHPLLKPFALLRGKGVAFICYLVLALTYSRASYLAYIIAIAIISWLKKTPKLFIIAMVLGILTIYLLPKPAGIESTRLQREESWQARVRSWKQALIIAKDYPLFGVGFNNYRYAQKKYGFLTEDNWQKNHAGAGSDSSLFFVLATMGTIGLISYLSLLRAIWVSGDALIKVSLTAVLVHSFFNNTLFYPWVMVWIWIIVGTTENK